MVIGCEQISLDLELQNYNLAHMIVVGDLVKCVFSNNIWNCSGAIKSERHNHTFVIGHVHRNNVGVVLSQTDNEICLLVNSMIGWVWKDALSKIE